MLFIYASLDKLCLFSKVSLSSGVILGFVQLRHDGNLTELTMQVTSESETSSYLHGEKCKP